MIAVTLIRERPCANCGHWFALHRQHGPATCMCTRLALGAPAEQIQRCRCPGFVADAIDSLRAMPMWA